MYDERDGCERGATRGCDRKREREKERKREREKERKRGREEERKRGREEERKRGREEERKRGREEERKRGREEEKKRGREEERKRGREEERKRGREEERKRGREEERGKKEKTNLEHNPRRSSSNVDALPLALRGVTVVRLRITPEPAPARGPKQVARPGEGQQRDARLGRKDEAVVARDRRLCGGRLQELEHRPEKLDLSPLWTKAARRQPLAGPRRAHALWVLGVDVKPSAVARWRRRRSPVSPHALVRYLVDDDEQDVQDTTRLRPPIVFCLLRFRALSCCPSPELFAQSLSRLCFCGGGGGGGGGGRRS